jgi:hypothetical protein
MPHTVLMSCSTTSFEPYKMGANWALYGLPVHSHFLYVLSGW